MNEAEIWVRLFLKETSSYEDKAIAANRADNALEEFKKRFEPYEFFNEEEDLDGPTVWVPKVKP